METIDKLVERQQRETQNLFQRKREAESALAQVAHKYEIATVRLNALLEAQHVVAMEEAKREAERSQLPRRRQRRLTKQWRQILSDLSELSHFSYQDIAVVAEHYNFEVTRDTMRSQMSIYKTTGLVTALEDGVFQLTDRGRLAAGVVDDSADEEGEEDDETSST